MIMQFAIGFVFGFVFGIVISVGFAPFLRAARHQRMMAGVVIATSSLIIIGATLTKGMEGFLNWAYPFWCGLILGVVVLIPRRMQ